MLFECGGIIGAFLFLLNNPFDPFRGLRTFDPIALLIYLIYAPQLSQLTCH